jgi:hypothetical protein
VALKRTRERPSPVVLAELPPGDRGIVASLGRHEDMIGRRFLLCGKLGGVMKTLGFSSEACAAVIEEWLGDADADGRGLHWALGAWEADKPKVSGFGGLAEIVGKAHAEVIWQACVAARPAGRIAL